MDHILLLEANQVLRFSIADLFLSEGLDVVEKQDSGDCVTSIMQDDPGVILLSEDMPSLESVELLPLLRRLTKAPIIVMGAGGETAVVNSLLQGADVYLTRPINFRELRSRVRSFFRNSKSGRTHSEPETESVVAEHHVPHSLRTSLTDIEARLLDCLMQQNGLSVDHTELMDRVWGGPVKAERLTFYIHRLRSKLLPEAISLESQGSTGYRLIPLI